MLPRAAVLRAVADNIVGGIAPSTASGHRTAVLHYTTAMTQLEHSPLFPATEISLLLYATWANKTLIAASIRTYISSIRSHHVTNNWPIAPAASMRRLIRCLHGIELTEKPDKQGNMRFPILFRHMQDMYELHLQDEQSCTDIYAENSPFLLSAVEAMAWFMGARPSEVVVRDTNAGVTSSVLRIDHVSFFNLHEGAPRRPGMQTMLPKTKTEQLGLRHAITTGCSGHAICAVCLVLRWLRMRAASGQETLTPESPLFVYRNKRGLLVPLPYPIFKAQLASVLTRAGHPAPAQSQGYSFRIGAASTLAHAGCSDNMIKTSFRWKSDAFMRYISRTSRETQAEVAFFMAHPEEWAL